MDFKGIMKLQGFYTFSGGIFLLWDQKLFAPVPKETSEDDHAEEESNEEEGDSHFDQLLPHQVKVSLESLIGKQTDSNLKLKAETTDSSVSASYGNSPELNFFHSFLWENVKNSTKFEFKPNRLQGEYTASIDKIIPAADSSNYKFSALAKWLEKDKSVSWNASYSLSAAFSSLFSRPKCSLKS